MSFKWILPVCAFFIAVLPALAGEIPLPVPGVTVVSFVADGGGSALVTDVEELGHVISANTEGGEIMAGEGGFDWKIGAEQRFGVGRINIVLDRKAISGDLALVFNALMDDDATLAVQLFDAGGKALALDLFGDLTKKAEEAGTDTFVIPLVEYPDAKTLVVRRLSGAFQVREILLTPVVSKATGANPAAERALAEALGEQLSGRHPLIAKAGLKLHVIPSLEEINDVGAEALAAVGYPRYSPLGILDGTVCYAPVSGTVYDFSIMANRYLSLSGQKMVFDWYFTSSAGVKWSFENDPSDYNLTEGRPAKTELGMASIPLTEEARAAFEKRNGYFPIEFAIARSAIEVLVNRSNPLEEITMDELRTAFGGSGGITWAAIDSSSPMADEPVVAIGGSPSWGTGKVFQEIGLKGGSWRPDIAARHDVVYRGGVEQEVADTPTGIGYAVQRKRGDDVKKLRIESTDGSGATLATADAVYSGKYPLQRKLYAYVAAPSLAEASPAVRELVNLMLSDQGQTFMVRTGSLPLSVDELVATRSRLGL